VAYVVSGPPQKSGDVNGIVCDWDP